MMKNITAILASLTAVCALALIAGCGSKETAEKPEVKNGSDDHDDHDHDHEGHTHGVGPHDGTVADWGGGKFHIEFTVDHDKQEAAVYILGDDQKAPVPIAAEEIQLAIVDPAMQVALKASPQEGDPAGKSSRFVGNHEGLGVVQEYEGTITGVVDGTPYTAEFKEEAHDHAHGGHSHGEDDALIWVGEPQQYEGMEIKLGHHATELHAGEEAEPAVSITRDGQPVSDAKVFNSLLSADGGTILAEEVATVFEPTTPEEPAHYAQGGLLIPKGTTSAIVRFRIVPAGGSETTMEMPVTVH